MKENSKIKLNPKKVLLYCMQIFFIILLIISSIEIYKWYKDNKKNKEILDNISNVVKIEEVNEDDEQKEELITINFDELKEKNSDTVAWIKLNSTNIEYPVVKTSNNTYYLNHSFDKSYNIAGWIFADYKNKFDNTDKNIVIYGHNIKDGSMFGSLKEVLTEEWYNNEENRNIIFITEDGNYEYKIFSIYQIEDEDYYIETEFKGNEFKEFINVIQKRSNKDFGEEVDENDQILTLSTCANNNKYRLVVHAKKVLDTEKTIINEN